jgi:hypothetical protein
VLTLSSAPISSYSTGQLTVLLSKNFKEAHIALKGKGIMEYPSTTSVGSISAAPDTTLFRAFSSNLQGYYFSPYIRVCAHMCVFCHNFFKAFSYFHFICLTFSEEQVSSSMALGDRIRETGNTITPVSYLLYLYNFICWNDSNRYIFRYLFFLRY